MTRPVEFLLFFGQRPVSSLKKWILLGKKMDGVACNPLLQRRDTGVAQFPSLDLVSSRLKPQLKMERLAESGAIDIRESSLPH